MVSNEIVIQVNHLSKKYQIGGPKEKYQTFRDAIVHSMKSPFEKFSHQKSDQKANELWALNDVSFDVHKGEVLGIIGRNGAGKSTLLKILSRVTGPSEGTVEIHGRIGSLLEVGTGFHPELTGRENIFLSGSILGMKRREIEEKFDEIVKFSEIEKFLDTPVKRYSSGMYVRLAFAVAAHMDTEILLVDEVLAVGDAAFQKKCMGKMEAVTEKEMRTVLFVSHNMGAIQSLCKSIIVLDKGYLKYSSEDVVSGIDLYLDKQKGSQFSIVDFRKFEDEDFKLVGFKIVNQAGEIIKGTIPRIVNAFVEIEFCLKMENPALNIGYSLFGNNEEYYYSTWMNDGCENDWPKLKIGKNILIAELPLNFINEGKYRIQLLVGMHHQKWIVSPADNLSLYFETQGALVNSIYWYHKRDGLCAPMLKWHSTDESSIKSRINR